MARGMFEGWANYYVLLGTSAGALIGVMALVATLTSGGGDPSGALRGQRLFLTPIVFHLAEVLTLSAVILAAHVDTRLQLGLMGGLALFGLGFCIVVGVQIAAPTTQTSHWSDFWCYGAAPAIASLLLCAALAWAWLGLRDAAPLVALGMLILLLTAIRNAWDLVTWLAPRRPAATRPAALPDKPDT